LIDRAENRLKPAATLAALARDAGLTPALEIVIYGRYGVDAALPWLALRHAGFPGAIVYDRGWVEWAGRPDLPIEPF
jgi:3-mercaptopyruvate sulfurtransferase SseA